METNVLALLNLDSKVLNKGYFQNIYTKKKVETLVICNSSNHVDHYVLNNF